MTAPLNSTDPWWLGYNDGNNGRPFDLQVNQLVSQTARVEYDQGYRHGRAAWWRELSDAEREAYLLKDRAAKLTKLVEEAATLLELHGFRESAASLRVGLVS